jgi:DNA-binding MarR family transcriptional regulator
MTNSIDLREVSGCTCLRLRRLTRQLTQAYDEALRPGGLTVNQFGLLATLHGLTAGGRGGVPLGALADRLGMHPTTLNRDLRPLQQQGFIVNAIDPGDRRVRALAVTPKGRARLRKSVPHWRQAQSALEQALGADGVRSLNQFLDLAGHKLRR